VDSARSRTAQRANRRRRAGFTLLEIAVTLTLLALAASLVAPALRAPRVRGDDLTAVVARAREAAVRRAEALVLRVEATGEWRLTAGDDTVAVGRGRLAPAPSAFLAVRFSPLGTCVAESGVDMQRWDALHCALLGGVAQ
jgi:prepilin-type N-terminal cleavage/methylation domain-containing protein